MIFNYKKRKLQRVKINLSLTILNRRCKRCGSAPAYYYFSRDVNTYPEVSVVKIMSDWLTKNRSRICESWFMMEDPSVFDNISDFSHQTNYKGYKPRWHKNCGHDPMKHIIEYLVCSCGQTSWAFNERASQSKPHIKQKKAKYSYPSKITY